MKKLATLVLVLMLLGSLAIAENSVSCTEHNYNPMACGEIGNLHKSELVCASCDAVNTPTVNCSQCKGTGKISCYSCSGRGTKSGSSMCYVCAGRGYFKYPEVKCGECKGTGSVNLTKNCSYCSGKGYTKCSTTETRTKCNKCYSSNLKCAACYDVWTKGVCPQCFPEQYTEFKYRSIMRSPDQHIGSFFKVHGRITRIELVKAVNAGKVYTVDLRYTDTEANVAYTYNVTYFASAGVENLLVGDIVDMWGIFTHYTTDNQPCFNIQFAQFLE